MGASRRGIGRPRGSDQEGTSSPLGVRPREERRAFILETAANLFKAKGYAATSVDDIARELGVTKATVYHYWSSKGELLEEIQDRALLLLRERLDRLDEEENLYGTSLEATVAAYIDAVLDNRAYISVLLRDFASSQKTRQKRRIFFQQCQEAIHAEIATGNIREFDPQVLTLAIVGLCSTIANWYEPEGRLSRDEVKEIFLGFASRGFLPLPEGTPEPGSSSAPSGPESPSSSE